MITAQEAVAIVKKNIVDSSITAAIQWENNWLFAVYTSDADEGELDPFYAVDVNTGEFSGFSIVGEQDTAGILNAFSKSIEHNDFSNDFLAHHGIKGMRWGVRRSAEQLGRSSSKNAGPSKASTGLEAVSNAAKPFLGPFIPRATITSKLMQVGLAAAQEIPMKTALSAATVSPLAIAGYAVTGLDSGAYRVPVVAAKNTKRGGWKKNAELSKRNMSQADIQRKVVSQINKSYPGLGTTNNCLRCTYAYEMRRRGYDVAATKTMLASGQSALGPKIMTKSLNSRTKINTSDPNTGLKRLVIGKGRPSESEIFKTLSKQPDGSRGDFQIRWAPLLGGHSIAYEIIGGKPVFFDTQSGKTYSSPSSLKTLTAPGTSFSFNRLDNKDLSSIAITAWVKDAN